jgi:hypothetical protein
MPPGSAGLTRLGVASARISGAIEGGGSEPAAMPPPVAAP